MSHYDFLGAFSPHFVAFMRRYLGTSEFRPRSASDDGPADHPGVCGTGCSRPVDFEEPSGSPKFPGNPLDHSPCSPTPAGSSARYGTRGQRTRHGPRLKPRRGLPTTSEVFGAQSHGVWSGCLRLVVAVSRPCTQDSLPAAGPSSAGRDSNPQSSYERFPSVANPSSFPELPWREPGRPGGSHSQGSHRSGRADCPHPVPLITASLQDGSSGARSEAAGAGNASAVG
jgi:hypothetical protein